MSTHKQVSTSRGCECEHESHFVERNLETGEQMAPYESHPYYTTAGNAEQVKTVMGTFWLCKECQHQHHMLPREG